VAKLEYAVGEKKLIFSVDGDSWCTVSVDTPDRLIVLGSDDVDVVAEKIASGLRTAHEQKTSLYEGANVFTLISLMGPHASVFASPQKNGAVELYFHEPHGSFYSLLQLGDKEADELAAKLAALAV
jgi:hypothetical protein